MMNEAAKEARRVYFREWQRKNKDKVKAAQARYWEKRALKEIGLTESDVDPEEEHYDQL